MTAATLFYQNQTHLTLTAINSFKTFKVITMEERKHKLVIYLKKWEDLNNLIGKTYDIDCKTLDWYHHAFSCFTRKSKDKSSIKDKSKISNNFQKKNPHPKDKATGTNRISLNTQMWNDREKKKDNSRGTSNQNHKSEDKKEKTKKSPRISK
ncbi:hypothetical protein RhiirA4_63331 [Rhizophagus irregularis]|uniref:Uncharacterized protein n=1 Tax=Rhizophagus irregularis TaxID=588596 RepID=A0A2I1G590_9GLOM|nr:hypothetical protein RhiirA4_63331 [Rhizophagus irregularis]